MRLLRACPCCNNTEAEKLFNIGFIDNGCLPPEYNIVSCEQCGFTFADSDASQEDYNEYYKKFNDYSVDADIKLGQELSGTAYESIFQSVKDLVDINESIIDLGCGAGQLLSIFKHFGYEHLLGLDPSDNAISSLKKRGMEGVVGNIFEPVKQENQGKYDIVLSTCVIEHVFDLYNYIELMKKYMKDRNSKIVLSLPAVEGFREHITAKPNYFNQEHINYFSVESLDNLMRIHGLKRVNKENYFYSNGEKFILAVYVKNGVKGQIQKDHISKKSIISYLEQYEIQNKELNEKLDYIEGMTDVIFFGVGQLASQILYERPELIGKIECFIDNNIEKQKRSFVGKRIYPASELRNQCGKTIVICSMLNSVDIEKQIREMGCKNEIIKLGN